MFEVIGRLVGGLEVPLKAFCCKARGGGGRLRQATETEDKEKRKEEKKRREDKENKLYILTIYPFKQILKVRIETVSEVLSMVSED